MGPGVQFPPRAAHGEGPAFLRGAPAQAAWQSSPARPMFPPLALSLLTLPPTRRRLQRSNKASSEGIGCQGQTTRGCGAGTPSLASFPAPARFLLQPPHHWTGILQGPRNTSGFEMYHNQLKRHRSQAGRCRLSLQNGGRSPSACLRGAAGSKWSR